MIDSGLAGRGAARAEDAQGTPTQSPMSPSILVYEDNTRVNELRAGGVVLRVWGLGLRVEGVGS